MYNIESLKNYYGNISDEEFNELVLAIYRCTAFLIDSYPNREKWFYEKHIPEVIDGDRDVLFVRNPEKKESIIAIAAIKNYIDEKKICTLYVKGGFRYQGIGSKLFEEASKILGTTKPIITFPYFEEKQFSPFIKKYDWELMEEAVNYYGDLKKELCYNGTITGEKKLVKK